jgi:hypothetical protein
MILPRMTIPAMIMMSMRIIPATTTGMTIPATTTGMAMGTGATTTPTTCEVSASEP